MNGLKDIKIFKSTNKKKDLQKNPLKQQQRNEAIASFPCCFM